MEPGEAEVHVWLRARDAQHPAPGRMRAAQQAISYQEYPGMHYPGIANWAVAELVEASARSRMTETAAATYRWIAEMTSASGTS